MRAVMIAAVLAGSTAMAAPPAADGAHTWTRWLPDLLVSVEGGLAGVYSGKAMTRGRLEPEESGFFFQGALLRLSRELAGTVRLAVGTTVHEGGIDLDEAFVGTLGLPWDVRVRAGLFYGAVGYENQRLRPQRFFVEDPLALAKVFGPLGHRPLGVDLAFAPPLPWRLDLVFGAMAATGVGQRSWYGDHPVEVETLRDFVCQLGLNNSIRAGSVRVGLGFMALLGPNDSGRRNGTDVYAFSAKVAHVAADPDKDVGFSLEAEWLLRRRQIPGDVLQDLNGWVAAVLAIGRTWAVGARYGFTQGVAGDPLDPTDDGPRHRAVLQLQYEPLEFVRLRLAGNVDAGGPHDDPVWGVLLQVEASALFGPHGIRGGGR